MSKPFSQENINVINQSELLDYTNKVEDSEEKLQVMPIIPTVVLYNLTMCQVLKIRVRLEQFACEDCENECAQRQLLMYHEVCIM